MNGAVIHIRRNAVGRVQVGRACAELLLIFPDNRLGGESVIVGVRSRNRRGFSLMPTVHQSHHNAELCVHRQISEIRAVVAVLRYIGIARIEVNAGLHAVDLVRSTAVGHQIFRLGCSRSIGLGRDIPVAVIDDDRHGITAAVVRPIRANIVVAKRGSAVYAFLARPRKGGHGQSRHHHQQAKRRRQDTPAVLLKDIFHWLLNHPFLIFGTKKSLCPFMNRGKCACFAYAKRK